MLILIAVRMTICWLRLHASPQMVIGNWIGENPCWFCAAPCCAVQAAVRPSGMGVDRDPRTLSSDGVLVVVMVVKHDILSRFSFPAATN